MASTYTVNIGIEKPGTGDQSGTWGVTTNTNFDIIDQATNGVATVTLAAAGTSGSPNTLLINNGALSDGRNRFIEFNDGADLGATAYVQLDPNDAEKIVHIRNSLSASRSLILFQGTYNASNDFEVPNGADVLVKFDGGGASATVTDVNVNLTPTKVTAGDLDVDNININGNTISSTDTNGNITLAPNGTGVVALSSTDLTFGDNDKAIFGAGSDLQIYHDGAQSLIDDAGTGELKIRSNILRTMKYTGETTALFTADGAVALYYDNAEKLSTTNTGVDVTGTITSDGLTVDGDGTLQTSDGAILTLKSTDTTLASTEVVGSIQFNTADSSDAGVASKIEANAENASGEVGLNFHTGKASALNKRININRDGDISFYDDTGVTQGFFWDASAESLGIGTTSPDFALDVPAGIGINEGNVLAWHDGSGGKSFDIYASSDNSLRFRVTGSSEAMRIDSSGNVGIGTTSASTKVEITGSSTSGELTLSNSSTAVTSGDTLGELFFKSYDPSVNTNTFTGNVASIKAVATRDFGGAGGADTSIVFSTNDDDAPSSGNPINLVERMRIDSSGNVGIGTNSPAAQLELSANNNAGTALNVLRLSDTDTVAGADQPSGRIEFYTSDGSNIGVGSAINGLAGTAGTNSAKLTFDINGSERLRIDSSGNLLVGTTDSNVANNSGSGNDGVSIQPDSVRIARTDGDMLLLNRLNSDGDIAKFLKDGTTVGSIGTTGGQIRFGKGSTAIQADGSAAIVPKQADGTSADGTINLGNAANRWQDLYLSGGVYLGGTGSDNLLDDYEEGSFDCDLGGVSASTNDGDGNYVKIGSMVFCRGYIAWTGLNTTDTSGFQFSLPFAADIADDNASSTVAVQFTMNTRETTGFTGVLSDVLGARIVASGTAILTAAEGDFRYDDGVDASGEFHFHISYRAS